MAEWKLERMGKRENIFAIETCWSIILLRIVLISWRAKLPDNREPFAN